MKLDKFALYSAKIKGQVIVTYQNERLHSIIFDERNQLTDLQYSKLKENIPANHAAEAAFAKLGLSSTRPEPKKQTPVSDKIALFCRLYKQFKNGLAYKVSSADAGKIKLLDLDEDLLLFYFKSSNFLFEHKHSISNLAKYYNELRADQAGLNAAKKIKHPSTYSVAHENSLTTDQVLEYWKHLRSLGLRPVKDRGKTVAWEKI